MVKLSTEVKKDDRNKVAEFPSEFHKDALGLVAEGGCSIVKAAQAFDTSENNPIRQYWTKCSLSQFTRSFRPCRAGYKVSRQRMRAGLISR